MANLVGQVTVTPFTLVADTATLALATNKNRKYLSIINGSVGILYFAWSQEDQATVQTAGITVMEEVPAGSSLLFDVISMPIGQLYLRSVAGDAVKVSEGI